MPKLFIATPCYGANLHAAYAKSLLATRGALSKYDIEHTVYFEPNDSLVQRARNVIVREFLASDCDRLLFIDGDLEWAADDVLRLLSHTEHPDIAVACGIYPRKSRELSFPVNFAIDSGRCLTWHNETGCVEIKDAPTGFLMIRREVIERMIEAYPERKCRFRDNSTAAEYALFDCFIDATGDYLSEDFGFSRLWQRIGGRLWADPNIDLAHYGQWKFTGSIRSILLPAGPPTRPQDIQGWMTDEELAFLTGAAAGVDSVVEVGCWKGRSTFALLSACRGPVYAVDHWQGSEGEDVAHRDAAEGAVFAEFQRNVGHFENLRVLRMPSLEAAKWIREADVCFIDGGHSYEEVQADIAAWTPKARKLICGHDFSDKWPDVKRAVTEAFGEIQTVGTIWMNRI